MAPYGPPSGPEVAYEVDGDLARISVAGELDLTGQEPLEAAVDAALGAGASQLVVDLTPTTFVDSTGLSLLLAAQRRAHADGAALRVVAPTGSEARVLVELTGVGEILDLHD